MKPLRLKEGASRAGYKSVRGFVYFCEKTGLRIYAYGQRIRRVDADELEHVLTRQRLEPDDARERVRAIAARRNRRPPEPTP